MRAEGLRSDTFSPMQRWPHSNPRPSHRLARVMAKRGLASRSEAQRLVLAGRVSVNGATVRDPEARVDPERDEIRVNGLAPEALAPCYLMLNKPRGLVTTRSDEQGRATVYACLEGACWPDGSPLPAVAPVGRLDMASEGLLLFSNDTAWAHRLTDPARHVPRHYHVQVEGHPSAETLSTMRAGVEVPEVGLLAAAGVDVLRAGGRNAWLAITLEAGRNRHIRRLLAELGHDVLRLVRVGIGGLELGELARGQWRLLEAEDFRRLGLAPLARAAL
jgi:23S rRNA pseudouridine2605 synthase